MNSTNIKQNIFLNIIHFYNYILPYSDTNKCNLDGNIYVYASLKLIEFSLRSHTGVILMYSEVLPKKNALNLFSEYAKLISNVCTGSNKNWNRTYMCHSWLQGGQF